MVAARCADESDEAPHALLLPPLLLLLLLLDIQGWRPQQWRKKQSVDRILRQSWTACRFGRHVEWECGWGGEGERGKNGLGNQEKSHEDVSPLSHMTSGIQWQAMEAHKKLYCRVVNCPRTQKREFGLQQFSPCICAAQSSSSPLHARSASGHSTDAACESPFFHHWDWL